jgi:hypothetical protein
MQVEGVGQCFSADALRAAIDQSPTLLKSLLLYAHVFGVQASYTALANAQGDLKERLARWLLMALDRIKSLRPSGSDPNRTPASGLFQAPHSGNRIQRRTLSHPAVARHPDLLGALQIAAQGRCRIARRFMRREAEIIGAVREFVRDTFVAIDARLLSREEKALVRIGGACALPHKIHRLRAMAVAALQRVVGLEPFPFVRCQLKPHVEEFFTRAD